jgi:hypothetical protein
MMNAMATVSSNSKQVGIKIGSCCRSLRDFAFACAESRSMSVYMGRSSVLDGAQQSEAMGQFYS